MEIEVEPMNAAPLSFEGAAFSYASRDVLRDVTFSVGRGELVAVLGKNGSGKTTLVRGAARVILPARGRVLVNGAPIERVSRRDLARAVAVVPQEGVPIFSFTVLETVLMGRAPWLRPFAFEGKEDLAAASEALAAVDALEFASRDLAELSGGERQRVIIARALAQGSPLLVADEPTAHLDLKHAVSVFDLLRRLTVERKLAVLLVTHDVNLAAGYCDRAVLLANGTVLADGRPSDVLTGERLTATYGVPVEVERTRSGVPFVRPRLADSSTASINRRG